MAYRVPPETPPPREILIETGSLTRRGRVSGYVSWGIWSAVVIALICESGVLDSPLPGTRLLLGAGMPALLALGALPAMILAHAVSLRARDRLVVDSEGLSAAGAHVIRWAEPLGAQVLQGRDACALVIRQAHARVVLFGSGIEGCLGDCRSWGGRWQCTEPGSAARASWSGAYVVRGTGDAIISGQVEPSEPLSALAADVLALALAGQAGEAASPGRLC